MLPFSVIRFLPPDERTNRARTLYTGIIAACVTTYFTNKSNWLLRPNKPIKCGVLIIVIASWLVSLGGTKRCCHTYMVNNVVL